MVLDRFLYETLIFLWICVQALTHEREVSVQKKVAL